MSDITKCNGKDCPIKEQCYRFTALSSDDRQSYFVESPFELSNNKFNCKMYWGENQENIFNQLKDIMK